MATRNRPVALAGGSVERLYALQRVRGTNEDTPARNVHSQDVVEGGRIERAYDDTRGGVEGGELACSLSRDVVEEAPDVDARAVLRDVHRPYEVLGGSVSPVGSRLPVWVQHPRGRVHRRKLLALLACYRHEVTTQVQLVARDN